MVGVERGAHWRERWSSVMGGCHGSVAVSGREREEEEMRGEEKRVFHILLEKWVCSAKHMVGNRISHDYDASVTFLHFIPLFTILFVWPHPTNTHTNHYPFMESLWPLAYPFVCR